MDNNYKPFCGPSLPFYGRQAISMPPPAAPFINAVSLVSVDTTLDVPPSEFWRTETCIDAPPELYRPATLEKAQRVIEDSGLNNARNIQLAGSGKAIKQLCMIPWTNDGIDMLCHKIGTTVYLEQLQTPQESRYGDKQTPVPSLENRLASELWDSGKISDIWKGANEVGLTFRNRTFSEQSSSYPKSLSYKIQTTNEGNTANLWEFSNLRMLVEHDIPYFGGENMPSISIRCNDEKPISILTGMDMWLDMMIKGIDDVVIVHQEKGHVQEYEVLLNSEVPTLEGSEFDPFDLANVIENVYKFLDQKMTQQGHTYYLHRDANSSDLVLYDMTKWFPDFSRNSEYNGSLAIVALALVKQAADVLNRPAPLPFTVIEVAYKTLQSALKLITPEQLPNIAATIYYLLACCFQSSEVDKARASESVLNLCGLESILIERNPEIMSSIPISALRSAVAVCDDDELIAAPRTYLPGLDKPDVCSRKVLEYVNKGLELLSKLDECRHNNKDYMKLKVFPVGEDDKRAHDQERSKNRIGSDSELLRSFLCLRAAVAYKGLVSGATDPKKSAVGIFMVRKGLRCCAEVFRLQSSGILRTAASVTAAELLVLYFPMLGSFTQLSKDERQDIMSSANEDPYLCLPFINALQIIKTSGLSVILSITNEHLENHCVEEIYKLSKEMAEKCRRMIPAYMAEVASLSYGPYKRVSELRTMFTSIAFFLGKAGDYHRNIVQSGLQRATDTSDKKHIRQAKEYYDLGLTFCVDVHEMGELSIVLEHNKAAMNRGLFLAICTENPSKPDSPVVYNAFQEAVTCYETLVERLNLNEEGSLKQQCAIADMITMIMRYIEQLDVDTSQKNVYSKPEKVPLTRSELLFKRVMTAFYRLAQMPKCNEYLASSQTAVIILYYFNIAFDHSIRRRSKARGAIYQEWFKNLMSFVRDIHLLTKEALMVCENQEEVIFKVYELTFQFFEGADVLPLKAKSVAFIDMICHFPENLISSCQKPPLPFLEKCIEMTKLELMFLLKNNVLVSDGVCVKEMLSLVLRHGKSVDAENSSKTVNLFNELSTLWPYKAHTPPVV